MWDVGSGSTAEVLSDSYSESCKRAIYVTGFVTTGPKVIDGAAQQTTGVN